MSNDLVADIANYLTCYPREREAIAECSLAESLWKMVRRILRTQSKRTSFEVCVLDEARRLADGHFGVLSRDLLAKLVVDQLLARLSTCPDNFSAIESELSHLKARI
jgi:hypothetical protein